MRTLILLSVLLIKCVGCQSQVVAFDIQVNKDEKGIFITTNAAMQRFYLISEELTFPPMIGTQLDTHLLHDSPIFEVVQYSPSNQLVSGKLVSNGSILRSGKCAQLTGHTLSLINFRIRCSYDKEPRDNVMAVKSKVTELRVSDSFADKVAKLLREK